LVAKGLGAPDDSGCQLRVKGVGNVRQQQADDMATAIAQGSRQAVRAKAEASGGLQNHYSSFLANAWLSI
jgi:hypothetical protein